jgi:hypothetical protein
MTVASIACSDHVVRRLPYELAREIRARGRGFSVFPYSPSPMAIQLKDIIRKPIHIYWKKASVRAHNTLIEMYGFPYPP